MDSERAFKVVETFADLIHGMVGAWIMVTHDVRICKSVDRVLQMRDGKLVAEYATKTENARLAKSAA
jgi:putative ABC transport system ATP-binding protein